MKSRCQKEFQLTASITVEAAYVMVMVILALTIMIQAAYGQCKKTTEVMKLHYIVEQVRHQEEKKNCILPHGQVSCNSGQVKGYIHTEAWEKEIVVQVHEPEELLRKMTILEWADGKK